jgi:hypothetical protein
VQSKGREVHGASAPILFKNVNAHESIAQSTRKKVLLGTSQLMMFAP